MSHIDKYFQVREKHLDSMLGSEFSLVGEAWDTNWASQYLKISDEELKILDSVPGWSKVHEETSEKQISEKENNTLIMENLSIPSQTSIPENTVNHSTIIPNPINAPIPINHNSDSPHEIPRTTPSEEKDNFMHSISLYFSRVVGVFSGLPRKRSNSTSDIRLLKVNEGMSSSKSETNLMEISRNIPKQQFVSDKCSAWKMKRRSSMLDPLPDETQNNQTTADVHSNNNAENVFENKTFDNLKTDILNHLYYKKTLEYRFEGNDIPSFIEIKDVDHDQLIKKLESLEKRFSGSYSSFKESTKNNFEFKSFKCQKQSPMTSKSAEEVSVTQTRAHLSSLSNDKGANSSTGSNISTNTTSSSHIGVEIPRPEKPIEKLSDLHSVAFQAENEAVVKLIPNVSEDKSCTSQQSKQNPVVIHLSKASLIPPTSDLLSPTQCSSIKASDINSTDAQSNQSVPCGTLSTDTHLFAHPYSEPATVKSKDVDMCVPVLCGISSSSDTLSSIQRSSKSHPEALSPMKSKDADICVPIPSSVSQSSEIDLSIHPNAIDLEIKSSINSTSSSLMSLFQSTTLPHSVISKTRSPIKFKDPESCVDSATPLSADVHTFMHSNGVNPPEAKSIARAEDLTKVLKAENETANFSVFSDNPSGWVKLKKSASGKAVKVSRKRKRQSKGDHQPCKKLSLSNSPADVQYTAKQVRNMIEIMRCHFKV